MSDFDFVRRWTGGGRPIWFVTGTDTDVGKTVVTGLLAAAVYEHLGSVTVVKPVQTGLPPGVDGDAQVAGAAARCASVELVRFPLPADPWLAALDAGAEPVRVDDLRRSIERITGPLVVEGAGGIMVPFNANEMFADLAMVLDAEVIITVGVRLGCINHALLTMAYLRHRGVRTAGFALVDRWQVGDEHSHHHLRRILEAEAPLVAHVANYSTTAIRSS